MSLKLLAERGADMRLPGYENCAANRGWVMADGGVTSARSKPGLSRPMGVWRAEPDLPSVSKPTAITLDLKDEVWMTRTLYAACVAGALALAPVAASAQYVAYGAYPYAAPYALYAYSPNWATPYSYSYPATASSAWGYPYWYGSNSPWTGSASASSHPAYYGGSGGYAYHPAYGFGY